MKNGAGASKEKVGADGGKILDGKAEEYPANSCLCLSLLDIVSRSRSTQFTQGRSG